MDFPSFLSKENKSNNKINEQDKKIEFSQKLSDEDKEDLPAQSSATPGAFNFLKKENGSFGNEQKIASPRLAQKIIAGENNKNKPTLSKKKSGFFNLFKKPDSQFGEGENAFDLNLVKGEIVKYFDWQKNILILFISIFFSLTIIAFIYWGISWWGSKVEYIKDPALAQNYYKLDKEIRALDEDVREISQFREKVQLVDDLLNNHIYWNNFFTFLEDITLSDVYFSSFSGSISGEYSLSASTNDFDAIDVQIKKLISDRHVKQARVNSGSISAGEEGALVSFELNFSIDQSLFVE